MKYTIEVTQQDINQGQRCKSLKCPVALALTRALGKECHVGPRDFGFTEIGLGVSLPLRAQIFVARFDLDGPASVQPFSFEIDIPDAPAN